MRSCWILPFWLCLCAAAAAAPFELRPPAKPQANLWLEGEEFVETRGGSVKHDAGCYGGKCWSVLTTEAGAYTVEYKLSVAADGFYTAYIAGQPVGTGYTSPLWYAVDGSAWRKVTTLPASKVSWGASGAVRWTVLGTLSLAKGEHSLTFKIDQHRPQDKYYAYLIDAIALSRDEDALPALRGERPGNVFTTEPLVFQSVTNFGSWRWRVVDWQGKEKLRGQWDAKGGALTLPQLPIGYYRLQLQDKRGNWSYWAPFARISPPERLKPESPYAMDSAQSWLAAPGFSGNSLQPENSYQLISDLEKLAGLSMVRERLSWPEVNPSPGVYKWGRYETNADLLSERGISILGMFHSAPEWTKGDLQSLPHDLLATYEFCKAAAEKFSGQMAAWEFWNEPEPKGFNQDPSWDLAAAHKAAYLGFKAGDPDALVLIASNCQHPAPKMYELLMESGAGAYMDAFNFHVYSQLDKYQEIVEGKREFLSRFGLGSKPMWVTENGLGVEGAGKEDPIAPGSNLREHDREQELAQAELLLKAQLTMQSLGVDRDFFFVVPPYNEQGGSKVWGFFRWDYTVKPAYVALANLTRQLGNCSYQGKVDLDGASAFLYEAPDGKQILVYWTEDEDSAREFTLKGQGERLEILDFLGGSQTIASESGSYRLSAGRFPTYLKGLSGLKATGQPPAKAEPQPSPVTDPSTVLRINLGKGFKVANKNVAKLEEKIGNFTLDIFNFSEKSKTLTVENMSDAYLLLGLPETIEAPAMAKTSFPLKLLLTKEDSATLFNLRLRARNGGLLSAPALIPVSPKMDGNPALEEKLLSASEPERWEKNSSGQMEISLDKAQEAVRFDVSFPAAGDRWIYPVFRLKPEELAGAVGLSFEVKLDVAPAYAASPYIMAYVMAVLEDELEVGERADFSYDSTEQWQKVEISFAAEAPAGFDPKDVKLLRIGMNPRPQQLTYWLRNLKVYYRQ
mgnify:CR=1 FL=1